MPLSVGISVGKTRNRNKNAAFRIVEGRVFRYNNILNSQILNFKHSLMRCMVVNRVGTSGRRSTFSIIPIS